MDSLKICTCGRLQSRARGRRMVAPSPGRVQLDPATPASSPCGAASIAAEQHIRPALNGPLSAKSWRSPTSANASVGWRPSRNEDAFRAAICRGKCVAEQRKRLECAPPYCGTTPSRPTLMRFASSVPSGFLVVVITVNRAPALRSSLPPIS